MADASLTASAPALVSQEEADRYAPAPPPAPLAARARTAAGTAQSARHGSGHADWVTQRHHQRSTTAHRAQRAVSKHHRAPSRRVRLLPKSSAATRGRNSWMLTPGNGRMVQTLVMTLRDPVSVS